MALEADAWVDLEKLKTPPAVKPFDAGELANEEPRPDPSDFRPPRLSAVEGFYQERETSTRPPMLRRNRATNGRSMTGASERPHDGRTWRRRKRTSTFTWRPSPPKPGVGTPRPTSSGRRSRAVTRRRSSGTSTSPCRGAGIPHRSPDVSGWPTSPSLPARRRVRVLADSVIPPSRRTATSGPRMPSPRLGTRNPDQEPLRRRGRAVYASNPLRNVPG